ncbi:DUF1573 domain-containing protein [Aureivirga sp. CE67]|uniref:DUF1573 domain-containing protein n=1 Tax=Aureivirga sp. CE67 TaxID=1788983 RepID=UPI0018CB5336|nr:DUF1573 domain-containing protein [Aureivirga sp. CE67]
MKKTTIILGAFITLAFAACNNGGDAAKKIDATKVEAAKERDVKNTENAPVIKFEKTEHDFGDIKEGDKVETEFKFTNTGKSDLIISNAKGSCGCTVPDYPKGKAIKPGEEGVIKVLFNSNGKPNRQTKTVTLTTNTAKGKELIKIKANVEPDPEKAEQRKKRAEEARKRREEAKAKKEAEAAAKK